MRLKLVALALVGLWLGGQEMGAAVFGGQHGGTSGGDYPAVTRPTAPGSPANLVARHDCWTGAAPHDVDMPGHVVVTTPDGTTRYAGRRMVHLALEQLFAEADHGLTVHGFCR